MMKQGYGWHVLYVKSRWEQKVFDSLQEISIRSFLPKVKSIKQWSDRKKTVIKPLIPSYVFVYIDSSFEFHKALSVNGACFFLSFGNDYAIVTEKEINQIKLLIGAENVTDIEMNSPCLTVGETKKISYGPLKGMECEILKTGNINKIIVKINSLRQNIMATIPISSFG